MELAITGTPKEIAAFVLELQKRQVDEVELKLDANSIKRVFAKSMRMSKF